MKNWTDKRDEILNAPLPTYGGRYAVIPHSVFLEEIQTELTNKGYEIADEAYLTTDKCKLLSGVFRIKSDEKELSPSIAFVNSYNKQRKAEIKAMAVVLCCKNGMMGTIDNGSYSRKHTGSALEDFREHISTVIGGLEKEFERLKYNKEEMKQIILDNKTIATLVGDMLVNEKLINPTQLSILQKELKKSQHFKGNTLWDFYNKCTEAFKDNHPIHYDKQHVKFHTYIVDKFQLLGYRGLFEPLENLNNFHPFSKPIKDTRIRLEDREDSVELAYPTLERQEHLEDLRALRSDIIPWEEDDFLDDSEG